tara:strand:- start:352 stop:942 length:591 start_codon:yes stop_codon:yes gene_type:complete
MENENTMPEDTGTEMADEDIHEELKAHGINMHHKTGSAKLRDTLAAVNAGTYEAPVAKEVAPVEAKPTAAAVAASKHQTKEQRAMTLMRVVVSPNDPLMSTYPGLIFTVGSSSVNQGRMIKKYVPFNNDEGWHIPKIIYDQINAAEMQKFKSSKMPNGEKVLVPYLTKKFNVQLLDPLTPTELSALAAAQQSRGGI